MALAASTASVPTRTASAAFCAISRIDAPISLELAATVSMLLDTRSAAATIPWAWLLDSSALRPKPLLTVLSSPDVPASAVAEWSSVRTTPWIDAVAWSSASAMRPNSSLRCSDSRRVRSPVTIASRCARIVRAEISNGLIPRYAATAFITVSTRMNTTAVDRSISAGVGPRQQGEAQRTDNQRRADLPTQTDEHDGACGLP